MSIYSILLSRARLAARCALLLDMFAARETQLQFYLIANTLLWLVRLRNFSPACSVCARSCDFLISELR